MKEKSADSFITELKRLKSTSEKEKIRKYFKDDNADNKVIGVRMRHTFDLAKEYTDIPFDEIKKLLESPYYEGRMGAVSIMDFKVRSTSASEEYRKKLFDLYINRHTRINNWDFIDRAAPRVVGGYLYDSNQSRNILYKLASSDNRWERRTAIVATLFFIRKKETDDTFAIAELLIRDEDEYVQKAVGTCLREAGKKDPERLLGFLERHASVMPRVMLTKAMEKLDKEKKQYFRNK